MINLVWIKVMMVNNSVGSPFEGCDFYRSIFLLLGVFHQVGNFSLTSAVLIPLFKGGQIADLLQIVSFGIEDYVLLANMISL